MQFQPPLLVDLLLLANQEVTAFILKLACAMCKGVYVCMTGKAATLPMHLKENGNVLMRQLVGLLGPYEVS